MSCGPAQGVGENYSDSGQSVLELPALTLTPRRLPLRFISEVPSGEGSSIVQQFDFSLQARRFFIPQARVALPA